MRHLNLKLSSLMRAGNENKLPGFDSIQASLEICPQLFCTRTGTDSLTVFIKKNEKDIDKFMRSTLNSQENNQNFSIADSSAEQFLSDADSAETDHRFSSALTAAIISGLNKKVCVRTLERDKTWCNIRSFCRDG
jgi:hypothetical protein